MRAERYDATKSGRALKSRFGSAVLVVTSFVLLAAFFFGLAIVAHKAGGIVPAFSSRPILLLPPVLSCAALAIAFIAFGRKRRREFWLQVGATATAFAAIFIATEIALRGSAAPTALGERIGATELLPHDWNQVRGTSSKLVQKYQDGSALYVEDPLLGWDIGKNRTSGDYASSAEGIRSARAGDSYSAAANPRIALIGDSFTFGEEVAFEHTWGSYLEQLAGAQVLNFGVPSHGLDQTLLKFEHKVRAWKPDVVVLSVLNAAPPRSGNIYLVLRPDQSLPFMKPRFVDKGGEISALNVPVIPAEKIYENNSIFDLPLLDSDSYFDRSDWKRSALHASYVMRYLFSRFPRWQPPREDMSEAALNELSARLIASLARDVENVGAKLVIVFLPERAQVSGKGAKHHDALAASLAKRGISIFDPTPCMLERAGTRELFVEGGAHYSAMGNAILAACLAPQVASLLATQAR